MKSLKFAKEKENIQGAMNMSYLIGGGEDERNLSFAAKNLRNEKEILAQELVNLNRELTKLRVRAPASIFQS